MLARVVAFEGVTSERIEQLRAEITGSGGPPEDIPATELMILHDPQAQKSLAIVLFENEDDYARGDATLGAMPTDDTPGGRVSVEKYDVAIRVTSETAAR
ncbi:MAG TPA: hypothetical protein VFI04_03190 [Gaiellaceae bacterium]|jgi:hypothetical protein|nr:hypothetical protein [Gaiellaceae bacterium]